MKQIHEAARKGFQSSADAYERGRPDYPVLAVERLARELGLPEGEPGSGPEHALELGAGTGKFTRLFARACRARITALEPVTAMRENLSAALQRAGLKAGILDGTAESIPLPDGSVDAVLAAQAFHWFDGPKALPEIHRVLKPGGAVGLLWNRRDESSSLMAELTRIVDPHEKGAPRYRTGEWRRAFDQPGSGFTPLKKAEFRHTQTGPPELALDRIGSISFIAALPTRELERVLEQVRELIASHPDTRGRSTIEFPYVTDIFWCHRA